MNYSSAEEVFEEIRKVTPQYAGISYARLGLRGIQWPCPDSSHPGTPILHSGKIARGKGLLVGVEFRPPAETPDKEYPFVLTTGRDYYQYHSATMTRKSWLLNNYCPESMAEINPEDGKNLGINDGDWIKITSRRGHVIVKAKYADRVPKGVVFKRFHFYEAAVNKLTNPILDPTSKIPELKVSAVKIEKHEKGKAI
jgi:predicted molibdopterin-dependent oxidoreductase YjgC